MLNGLLDSLASITLEITHLTLELLSFLFLIAILAGALDTLAGGGGLICLPALILSGVPPLVALGTNKLQGSMGTATATFMMIRKKKIRIVELRPLMIAAFIGASIGTIAVQFINTQTLSFVIPSVLVLIAVYFLVSPKPRPITSAGRDSNNNYGKLIVPSIGFYDGMFGPGTGSFFALSGVVFRGYGLVDATAAAKPLNFATNMASLLVFLLAGQIAWAIGIVMMLGQLVGAWIGSHCLFRINPAYLRSIIVIMCVAMLAKYAHSMGWFNALS